MTSGSLFHTIREALIDLEGLYPEAMAVDFRFRTDKVGFRHNSSTMGWGMTFCCAWWKPYTNPQHLSLDDKVLVLQAFPALVDFVKAENERLLPLEGTPFKWRVYRQAEIDRAIQKVVRLFES